MSEQHFIVDLGADLEKLARQLEASGEYRVSKRLKLSDRVGASDGSRVRTGMFVDVETTGLDDRTDEILEIAIIPFAYGADGRIVEVGQPLQQFNEPEGPIPDEVFALTGLTNADLIGHKLDPAALETFIQKSDILVAHNAAFDRPFVERIAPVFAAKPWACTMCDVSWKREGIEGRRLSEILSGFGYFFDAHRATDDCEAGIALLTMSLPLSGERVLSSVLKAARQPTWRVFAEDAPFQARDVLKSRGYKWNVNRDFGPRAWWKDCTSEAIDTELEFLQSQIYGFAVQIPIAEITAFQRYAKRSR